LTLLQVDGSTRKVEDPRIISRGFVYEQTEGKLLSHASGMVRDMVAQKLSVVGPREATMEVSSIKKEVIKMLEKFFMNETGRRPLIIAEVIVT
jgi:mRNA degradation ribonuclease J1/J2